MPRGKNQKLKLYFLSKILLEKTDDDHTITMPEIQDELKKYDVEADRKSLYADLEVLEQIGLEIIRGREGKAYVYSIGKRRFEVADLKLLVDAVQASKFITERKSNELIGKLASLASVHEAKQLKRQVVVQGRVKNMNESTYYCVDSIYKAIDDGRQISFDYMQWNTKKELQPKRDGRYLVSPWVLAWANENYYMIAYDAEEDKIKHFRVDKMEKIRETKDKRLGKEAFEAFDIAKYSNMNFGMYHGDNTKVKLAFRDTLVGVIIDRFGRDIMIHPAKQDGWSETHVDVAVSDQFFGWIFGLGTDVRIAGPKEVSDKFRERLEAVIKVGEM